MNVFLENYITDHRATFKAYVRRDMARLTIKMSDGNTVEASARNYDGALNKLLSMLSEKKEDRKAARREKRKMIESFLSEADVSDEPSCE